MPFRFRPRFPVTAVPVAHTLSLISMFCCTRLYRLTCVQWLICTLSTLEQPRRVDGEPPLLSIGEQRDEARRAIDRRGRHATNRRLAAAADTSTKVSGAQCGRGRAKGREEGLGLEVSGDVLVSIRCSGGSTFVKRVFSILFIIKGFALYNI